jgi:hypothetical protein
VGEEVPALPKDILSCLIQGNSSRTWQDRQIKIGGNENNAKGAKRYSDCLPGDGPELMPLDNHLFGNLQEGAAKNVALSYYIKRVIPTPLSSTPLGATPQKVHSSLQWTIQAGCPSKKRIKEALN